MFVRAEADLSQAVFSLIFRTEQNNKNNNETKELKNFKKHMLRKKRC